MENISFGKMMAMMMIGTDEQALAKVIAIEKMIDSKPDTLEREEAKEALLKALLRK